MKFTKDILNDLGDVSDLLGAFLEEQIEELDDPSKGLIVLKSFVSAKGTKRQITSSEVLDFSKSLGSNLAGEELQSYIQKFVNLRILRDKDENGRYELRHDALAAKIYEKITVVEKEVLEVRQFIEGAYDSNLKRGVLLSPEDLRYIAPYEDKLYLDKKVEAFIQESKAEAGKKKRRRQLLFGTLITIFVVGISYYAYSSYQGKIEAEKQQASAEKQGKIDKANYLASEAVQLMEENPTLSYLLAEKSLEYGETPNAYKALFNSYANGTMSKVQMEGESIDPFSNPFIRIDTKTKKLFVYQSNGEQIGQTVLYKNHPPDLVKITSDSVHIIGVFYTDSVFMRWNLFTGDTSSIQLPFRMGQFNSSDLSNNFYFSDAENNLHFYNVESLTEQFLYRKINRKKSNLFTTGWELKSSKNHHLYVITEDSLLFLKSNGEKTFEISINEIESSLNSTEGFKLSIIENYGYAIQANNANYILVDLQLGQSHLANLPNEKEQIKGGEFNKYFFIATQLKDKDYEYNDLSSVKSYVYDSQLKSLATLPGYFLFAESDSLFIFQKSFSPDSNIINIYDTHFDLNFKTIGKLSNPFTSPVFFKQIIYKGKLIYSQAGVVYLLDLHSFEEVALARKVKDFSFVNDEILISAYSEDGKIINIVFDSTGIQKTKFKGRWFMYGEGDLTNDKEIFSIEYLEECVNLPIKKIKRHHQRLIGNNIQYVNLYEEGVLFMDSTEVVGQLEIPMRKSDSRIRLNYSKGNDLLIIEEQESGYFNAGKGVLRITLVKNQKIVLTVDPYKIPECTDLANSKYTFVSNDTIFNVDLVTMSVEAEALNKKASELISTQQDYLMFSHNLLYNKDGVLFAVNIVTGDSIFLIKESKLNNEIEYSVNPSNNNLYYIDGSKVISLDENLNQVNEFMIDNSNDLKIYLWKFTSDGDVILLCANFIQNRQDSERTGSINLSPSIYSIYSNSGMKLAESYYNAVGTQYENFGFGDPFTAVYNTRDGLTYSLLDKSYELFNFWPNGFNNSFVYHNESYVILSEIEKLVLNNDNYNSVWFFPATPKEVIRRVREEKVYGQIRDFTPEEKEKYDI
jgi:hypothetical protein